MTVSHVDVPRITEYREEAAKLTGEPSLALLFRHLSASRLVTIAQIEGRVRGAGSEFVLACDMRFAARESAIFGQPEQAFGLIPGAGAQGPGQYNRACAGRGLPSRLQSLRRGRAQPRGAKPDPGRHDAPLPDSRRGNGWPGWWATWPTTESR